MYPKRFEIRGQWEGVRGGLLHGDCDMFREALKRGGKAARSWC